MSRYSDFQRNVDEEEKKQLDQMIYEMNKKKEENNKPELWGSKEKQENYSWGGKKKSRKNKKSKKSRKSRKGGKKQSRKNRKQKKSYKNKK